MAKNKKKFDEISYLKQFNPEDLLNWFQVIIIHPNNQLYLHRIEFIIGILFSIPEEEFGFKTPTQKDIKSFFTKFNKKYKDTFFIFEDFKGFDQRKLVPVFIDGKQYYPFNGGLERPTEYYKSISNVYNLSNQPEHDDVLFDFMRDYHANLQYQTDLIKKMLSFPESNKESKEIYIPTSVLISDLKPYFQYHGGIDEQNRFTELGQFHGKTEQEILDLVFQMNLFEASFAKINGKIYYLYPHLQYSIFLKRGLTLLTENEYRRKLIFDNFQKRLWRECLRFFTNSRCFLAILLGDSPNNILEDKVDFVILIDTNKLLLFSAVPHIPKEDLSEVFTNSASKLLEISKTIKKNEIIQVFNSDFGLGIETETLEIWCLPIFEPITLNYFIGINSSNGNDIIFPFSMMDLEAVFKRVGNAFDFLKFIREDINLMQKKSNPFTGEFMDRFAYYLGNGKSYFRSGQNFDFIFFEPHTWHYYFMEEQFLKYQDQAYIDIEKEFPDYFNFQRKHGDNIYLCFNTAYGNGAYLAKMKTRNVWIFTQEDSYKQNKIETRYSYDVLMPLFADYLVQFEVQFSAIFEGEFTFSYCQYEIVILPLTYIKDKEELAFLQSSLTDLNVENPMGFDTRKYTGNRIRTTIIFDPELSQNLFSLSNNRAERYCVKKLIISILLYCGGTKKIAEKKAQEIIDKNLPLGPKGYSMEAFHISNPRLNEYRPPHRFNDTDTSIVNRKLSEFLIEKNYQPGEYFDKEAEELNYHIYCFLQKLLESKIAIYDSQLLNYSYAQLERVEGEYVFNNLKSGMQAKGRVNYDVLETVKERENEKSQLSGSIKHIIHTILKKGITGSKYIVGEEWTELLSIAKIIIETSMIYDYIHFDLRKYKLIINHHFVLEFHVEDEAIDSIKYSLDRAKVQINNAKSAHSEATNLLNSSVDEDDMDIKLQENDLTELNKAFRNELGFSYENLVFVLGLLNTLNTHDGDNFPLTILSIDQIVSHIQENDKQKMPSQEIENMLRFLSLKEGIYEDDNLLIPANMMRNKERINVSPFIELKDGKFLYGNEVVRNALNLWIKPYYGDFPFQLSKDSEIHKAIKKRHQVLDKKFEQDCISQAINILGEENVEANILNFKRLSQSFAKRESCGEIDILCLNRETQTVFVLDAKNINLRSNLYYARQNINEFFKGHKSYYSKLGKKKTFVQKNLSAILSHFHISTDHAIWNVRQGFIINTNHFAAYSQQNHVGFIHINDLASFLNEV